MLGFGAVSQFAVSQISAVARRLVQAGHERAPATVLEIDLDFCNNTFGVAPCTAGRIQSGAAQGGSANTIQLAAAASAVDGFYVGKTVRITAGTGAGQEGVIAAYVGATRTATISGVFAPAPIAGSAYDVIDRPNGCYNVFGGASPCQNKPNYSRGVKTVRFCDRGMPTPPGELIRPYIVKAAFTPTLIDTSKGLAMRSQTQITLIDEPCPDVLDLYAASRVTPAAGTFWGRLIARNPNAVGRFARARKGYAVAPWDWSTFQTELYVVDAIKGPDTKWQTNVMLSDAIKLLDRSKIPAATDGKLMADVPAVSFTGAVAAAAATSVTLPSTSSAVDGAYTGQEVFIFSSTGSGQRRAITAYVGSSRTATVAAWSVIPDTTSFLEITPLSITLNAGKGALYTDPAASGKNEYVRIQDEVIRYTAKAGDVLSWSDGTMRAQFGTVRADHKQNDQAQLCRAWINKLASDVVHDIINVGGLADAYIDLVQLARENADWLGEAARITACVADPDAPSALLADLLKDLNMMCWWHPIDQKVKFKCDMPQLVSSVVPVTDDKLMLEATDPQRLDALRITQAAVAYNVVSATVNRTLPNSYRAARIYIDVDAESANGYGDTRPDLRQSRWLTTPANDILAIAMAARKVSRLRDAPSQIGLQLDPRDEPVLGSLVDVTTRKLVDATGAATTVRCRVVQMLDNGSEFDSSVITTNFLRRYGFIAPAGYPDFGAASAAQKQYAYVAGATDVMSDGSAPYLVS